MDQDPILYAAQIGRLDVLSFLLLLLEVMIALSAIVAFINLRGFARRQATDVAEQIGRETAERAANSCLQNELPKIYAANVGLLNAGDSEPGGEDVSDLPTTEEDFSHDERV